MFQVKAPSVSPVVTALMFHALSSPSVDVSVKVAMSRIAIVVLPAPPSLWVIPEVSIFQKELLTVPQFDPTRPPTNE
jgi:hypothetical protein